MADEICKGSPGQKPKASSPTAWCSDACWQQSAHRRIPQPAIGSHTHQREQAYRGGPHMRSLISIDFPAPKMEPESAHVVSAVSVHWLQCGNCDAARPRQHTTPGQKFFLLTSCSNPLPLDSWQVSYESHGGSRISCFALKKILYSDLKYDPPRRPREMRIISPRLRIMLLIRR